MKKGLFIVFEGCEGAGKSTVVKRLYEYLKSTNVDTIVTREPGGGSISEQIREVIVSKENTDMTLITEILLYAASRNQHIHDIIKPALEAGKVILCDRFVDTSIVYQGFVGGGLDIVGVINKIAIEDVVPDAIIYLDIDPKIGLDRIAKNNRETNRFDEKSLDFHNKCHSAYDARYEYIDNVYRIDASLPEEEVIDKCMVALAKIMAKRTETEVLNSKAVNITDELNDK